MKKLLLLTCVIITSVLHAMEQQQCWLAKLPPTAQVQIIEYVEAHERDRKRSWLAEHLKVHKQGNGNNPVTVWDEVKKKYVTFSMSMRLSLHMKSKQGKKILYQRPWDHWVGSGHPHFISFIIDHAHSEYFAAQLTKACQSVVFLEFVPEQNTQTLHVIDVSSSQVSIMGCPLGNLLESEMAIDKAECVALSRTKDIALLSNNRLIVLNPDLTLKSNILLPDPADQPVDTLDKLNHKTIDFSYDGSMVGVRWYSLIIDGYDSYGLYRIKEEGPGVIKIFDIPTRVTNIALQEYFARIGVCKELGKKQQEIT